MQRIKSYTKLYQEHKILANSKINSYMGKFDI